ncbi:MAG: hypothetical protein ONB16_06785 [candidate division KSB1 bacterium]|nr:hypothetical protein [candidate division KSB1 bacterium]MDZ7318327.1 hypothetical protein [candidate division KSB1 bacterium]MDZ7340002.1 hypothetical protein [candidate division KSB1 bacterium]
MQTDYTEIPEPYDLINHLLSIAYFYGDFSIPFQLMNTTSQVYLSVKKGDIVALRKFAARNWIDLERLSGEKRAELEKIYQTIIAKYAAQIQTELSPLPPEYLTELGERAILLGHYRDAHSAFKAIKGLDRKVNELVSDAIQLLKSREVAAHDKEDVDQMTEKVQQAVDRLYIAIRLKNPFGNQFQRLGPELHYEDLETFKKYIKYVEQSLLKEILEFGIQYLIDDHSISEKIIAALATSRARRLFLKHLAIRFSGGDQRYNQFIANYRLATEQLKKANSDKDFLEVQRILLGRGTGDNKYFQFLRELSLEHPISALLVITMRTPGGELYISPLILKSENSLLDFLEIG